MGQNGGKMKQSPIARKANAFMGVNPCQETF